MRSLETLLKSVSQTNNKYHLFKWVGQYKNGVKDFASCFGKALNLIHSIEIQLLQRTTEDSMKKGVSFGRHNDGRDDDSETKYSVRTLQDNLDNLAQLQHEHRQRLQRVEEECNQLTKFRDDYLHLQKRLKTLPDKTSHEIMVPFGPLAFMPGCMIHTNEILVLLGDNWFAERSAKEAIEMVKRRVKDCNEKIKNADVQKNIHINWLKETSDLFELDKKGQMEIIEELTEEEFEKSKEEHRKKVAEHHQKKMQVSVKENTEDDVPSESGASTSQENFMNKLDESDRKAYESIMQRLDQLELEEDEESVGSQDTEDYDRDEKQNLLIPKEEIYGALEGAEFTTGTEEKDVEKESLGDTKFPVKSTKKLKRRVSWADDMRPLHTVIPDDDSASIYRIKYSTKQQLSLPVVECEAMAHESSEENEDTAIIQSPSDIFKVFGGGGGRRSSLQDTPPRGILKKTFSNPESQSGAQGGWRYSSESTEIVNDSPNDDPLPPQPSKNPTSKDTESLEPAFSYRIVERKVDSASAEAAPATASEETQNRKVSRFKASRMKK